MVVTDVIATADAPAVEAAAALGRSPRGRSPAWGAAYLLVGAALIVVGTMVLNDATALLRVIVALIGVALVVFGIDVLARRRFGDDFETGVWLAGLWLFVIVLAAICADFLPLAEHQNVSKTLSEPSLMRPDLFSRHPLGTDRQGLDILGGVIYGARVSLFVGLVAVLVGMAVGTGIGIVAGYFRGKVDAVVGLFTDALLAFPSLILLLAMVAALDPSVRNITLALALLAVPTYIRISRATTLVFAQREFVVAARALGASRRRLLLRELLPNVVLPVMSYSVVIVGALIVAESSLSYLGLGVPRPRPTWGNMISAAQEHFERNPHVVFVPGTCLFLTVSALGIIGERARRAWDPRYSAV